MEHMALIEQVFEDNRKVTPVNDEMHIFCAEDNSLIYMDIVLENFDTTQLLKYVELAEELYKDYHTKVYLYLICPSHIKVLVREFDIKSEADFTIKLASMDMNPYEVILTIIKKKIQNNMVLDESDIEALQLLPMVCPPSEQHRIREEVFKIMNEVVI